MGGSIAGNSKIYAIKATQCSHFLINEKICYYNNMGKISWYKQGIRIQKIKIWQV